MIITKKLIFIFLHTFLFFTLSYADGVTPPDHRKEILSKLIKFNDEQIPEILRRQLVDQGNIYFGAVFDRDSVVSPIGTSHLIQTLMCSYVSAGSSFFKSQDILQRMIFAANALLRLQHEDGTIDLLTTNFHSTPDLGFTIYPTAFAYSIMLKNNKLHYGELPEKMKQYLLKAGKALTVGGIHTPNHRWVVSGALAWINTLFPNPMYKNRVDQWLAEKIDIDQDGQYNERSTAVYTPITNMSLITLAKKMNYHYLYDHVRKNLNMTFFLVHSNGEIATESSNRQDQYIQRNMAGYYLAYTYMAILDKDSRYAGMVEYIEKTVPLSNLGYILPYLIDDPALLQPLPKPDPLPTNYHKYFTYSDMVRIRREDVDLSIIMNNPTFITYFKGEAALEGIRLSSAFFGKGQFQSQQVEKEGETYVLSATLEGPYFQPLPKNKLPVEGEAWGQVNRSEREQSEVQTLTTKIYITESNGKVRIKIAVDGPVNLPITLEIAFRLGGILSPVIQKEGIDHAFLIKEGEYAVYQKGKDSIKIGPGKSAHKWTQLRGALPKLQADCLYFTRYAPCEFEFTIE